MKTLTPLVVVSQVLAVFIPLSVQAQKPEPPVDAKGNFQIALPEQDGAMKWAAPSFTVMQMSAKPRGLEIGVRGADKVAKISFLAFLFKVGSGPASPQSCRDGDLAEIKRDTGAKVVATPDVAHGADGKLPVAEYENRDNRGGTHYSVTGYLGSGQVCMSLEFYSDAPLHADDPTLKPILDSLQYDPNYKPQFKDAFVYGQLLYDRQAFGDAAPYFEQAVALAGSDGESLKWKRVATDQAGMAYGISGNLAKARDIFGAAIATDPDYPLYYYNLACADAEAKDLVAAKKHLLEAFERKQNIIAGEQMPNPSEDDSFTPYRNDQQFWAFVISLH